MSIIRIEAQKLRRMENNEGLVIQGCGGDLQEWVDGINDMLTEAGILINGSRFENCYAFENENLTCILFPFEDVVKRHVKHKKRENPKKAVKKQNTPYKLRIYGVYEV